MLEAKNIKITLVRSTNGVSKALKECVKGLGLRKMHHQVVRQDNPTVRGLIAKITYMLKVEEV